MVQQVSVGPSVDGGSDGSLRQAILTGASALLIAGGIAQDAQAASCGTNTTSISAGASCTGPLNWTLSSGTIVNSGTITGVTGVSVASGGRTLSTVTNNGTISVSNTALQAFSSGAIGTIINTGLVQSTNIAISALSGGSMGPIFNSGTINGGIINRGTAQLTIHGGSGSTWGTLTSPSAIRTIESTVAGLVFASGNSLLDVNVNTSLARTATNVGATLKLINNRTITGNFAQTGGSLVLAGTSPASFSKLVVTGTASLTGGDIVLIPLSGSLTAGDYTIVSATGGVTSSVAASSTGFTATSSTIGGTNLVVTLATPVTPPSTPSDPAPPSTPTTPTQPTPPASPTAVDTSQPYFTFSDPAGSGSTVTFNGGRLLVVQNTTTGQNFVVLATGGIIDTNRNQLVMTGNVANAGTLQIVGGGQLVSSGTFTGGTTTVTNTQFSLNGSLSGTLQIGSDATLRGTGTISGPTAIAGTLRPGNSPGSLTFTQPVALTSSATLALDIDGTGTGNGAGNYSRVLVQGAPITVAGTIAPILRGMTGSATNSYTPTLGQRFDVVHADGGITGAFTSLAQPSSGLAAGTRFDTLYGTNDLYLVVTPSSYGNLSGLGLGQTSNQQGAGSALDAWRPTAGLLSGETGSIFNSLYGLSAGEIGGALDEIAGAVHADAMVGGLSVQRQFGSVLDDRMSMLRGGDNGMLQQRARAGLSSLQFGLGADGPLAEGQLAGSASGDRVSGTGLRPWVQAFGRSDHQDSTGNAPGVRNKIGGGIAGADVAVTPDLTLGAALGYAHDDLKTKSSSRADLDVVQLSGYGSLGFGAAFVDGQVSGAWSRTETDRTLDFGGFGATARGDADGFGAGAAIRAGLRFASWGWGFEPSFGLRYDHVTRDAMTESGAGALSLTTHPKDLDALRSTLLMRTETALRLGETTTLVPSAHLGWAHELADRSASTTTGLAGGGTGFTVASNSIDRDKLLAGLGIALAMGDNLRLFGDYALEAGEHGNSNAVTAGLRYSW